MDTRKVLHDIKNIALLIGEWEESDRELRERIIMAFDKLYKDLENDLYKKENEKTQT